MENSKLFELMEKMYGEMQAMSARLESEIHEIKANMATKQDIARLEDKMDDNDKALYDGYTQTYEGICEVRENLEILTDRVENQEIKLQILKAVK
ncbi:hypothetical protein EAL2_808p06450 (plasmid) [Peptoclostridium acidaminophilum DSM 3953]|uniref:Uncharacterized protein n=1 Tax=Peptoclostridium acidaminophilum DSM 3953 TaxID=1286171 RepID=W8TKA5_PEPAC|nr:hypothetical protein [Peptoclostridium acidaminophilum]AHM58148.1 hypothetical protein EAL2_808p06450 [Peptoclostridium acidaminophilum DSM 3953]